MDSLDSYFQNRVEISSVEVATKAKSSIPPFIQPKTVKPFYISRNLIFFATFREL